MMIRETLELAYLGSLLKRELDITFTCTVEQFENVTMAFPSSFVSPFAFS